MRQVVAAYDIAYPPIVDDLRRHDGEAQSRGVERKLWRDACLSVPQWHVRGRQCTPAALRSLFTAAYECIFCEAENARTSRNFPGIFTELRQHTKSTDLPRGGKCRTFPECSTVLELHKKTGEVIPRVSMQYHRSAACLKTEIPRGTMVPRSNHISPAASPQLKLPEICA